MNLEWAIRLQEELASRLVILGCSRFCVLEPLREAHRRRGEIF